ncbi:SUF system Fe-S cluster assembly regulator [Solimonas sp. SE-A11]|uniref:SUF system Fe-S cluster assembly regulator n=1 Tax=Solimonas sp. SE-A11 TaxID=3054954 RepID=UPI00259CE156|nr:SUF system Fe-S cluster assembly regulator [Solimonas sp. SE-A11]MDM4770981.1 SUF system Fe-S cluster assembly regulator [Solimonas sp. SE-A11]
MLKLSKLADYATVVMTLIAAEPARVHTGVELAERSHIPAPTVAKLLKTLTKGGLLESSRGAHGGYRLVRAPGLISVAEVIRALEGPIGITECSIHEGSCGLESQCGTRHGWRLINTAIRQALEAVTLDQLAAPQRRSETPVQFISATRMERL